MPMRCMEHQDEFVRAVYLVGDEDERGKSLSANVEMGDIAEWQAHHHHQLGF